MLSIFNKKKDFNCFVCGNTDKTNGKKTTHGDICGHCITLLDAKGVSPKDSKSYTTEQLLSLCDNTLSAVELANKFVVPNAPIVLKEGESCYYVGSASGGKIKTVTKGYTGGSKGVSIRIMKGVTYHTGGSKGHAVKEEVLDRSPLGTFIITGTRLVLLTSKYGFEIAGNKITSIEMHADGFAIYVKDKMHMVLTPDVNKIATIIRLITSATEEVAQQKASSDEAKPKTTRTRKKKTDEPASNADEIRKYKQLADDGIISQEEFEQKKRQLLGL